MIFFIVCYVALPFDHTFKTRWLYCVECPQYSIRFEGLGYLCTSCLLAAFDEAQCLVTQ